MKKAITMVGTSLYQNAKSKLDCSNRWDNLKDKSCEERKDKEDTIKSIKEAIKKGWQGDTNTSAEIASIIKIQAELSTPISVHLIATDTVRSYICAELIKEWFEEHRKESITIKEICPIPGLQVKDKKTFEDEGMVNLVDKIVKIAKNDWSNCIFNITGGYKASIPFITILAQIKNSPLYYLFEESEKENYELIKIPQAPLSFDFSAFTDEHCAFDMITGGKKVINLPTECDFTKSLNGTEKEREETFEMLKNLMLIAEIDCSETKDKRIKLSTLGEMLYELYDERKYSTLLGKVMEIKVFEFFKEKFPNATIELGKKIGKSEQGDRYDLDVFVENEKEIWCIEVKPQNVDMLAREDKKGNKIKDTLEYKCQKGAFHQARNELAKENKQLHLAILTYHIQEPHRMQEKNFMELYKKYPCIRWIWLDPESNYKTNTNWEIAENRLKEFNIESKSWKEFTFKTHS